MADDDQFDGRKPSFKDTRNGPQLRGFRSRPGSPLHDPTSNIPISGYAQGLTEKGTWDRMFRNKLTGGMNPLSPEYRSGESPMDNSLDTINQEFRQRFTPSLETMASGGMNHAQRWSQQSRSNLPGGWTFAGMEDQDQIRKTYRPKQSPFGWGSAFEA